MAFAQDTVISREPAYTGGESAAIEPFATKAEAMAYADALAGGELDPFLARAWKEIRVGQPRNEKGQFEAGWRVTVTFNRPGNGEASL